MSDTKLNMITEKGTLAIGIEHGGKTHKEFVLKPQMVRDSIEAIENERARRNESYLGLCILEKQLEKLGDIPRKEVTPELLMDMYEVDLAIVSEASRRLQKRQRSFRCENSSSEKNHPCDAKDGL